jgi:hypothetical protein
VKRPQVPWTNHEIAQLKRLWPIPGREARRHIQAVLCRHSMTSIQSMAGKLKLTKDRGNRHWLCAAHTHFAAREQEAR